MQDLCCGVWDPVPQAGIESGPPVLGVQSLSHWTTREVPWDLFSLAKIRYADGNSGHEGSRLYSQTPTDGGHGTPHRAARGSLRPSRRQRGQGESMAENPHSDFCGKKRLTREVKQGRHARDWLAWIIPVGPEAEELPLVIWKLTPS